MGSDGFVPHDATRLSLGDGMDLAGLDVNELWWRYVAIGGSADLVTLAACLLEVEQCDRYEHDLIAQALNEAFLDRGADTFPVGYIGPDTCVPNVQTRPKPAQMSRSLQARQDAALARLRSAAAARRAVELHSSAARLMRASGQLHFARHAEIRARAARDRATASAA